LYGSRARGDNAPDSDVDIVITLDSVDDTAAISVAAKDGQLTDADRHAGALVPGMECGGSWSAKRIEMTIP
jgi:predicted nucleotidyltransferase